MSRKTILRSPETLTLIALLTASVLSLIFLGGLVAEPKALFGRSLSAIAPDLFPRIVLTAISVMCALALVLIGAGTAAEPAKGMTRPEWLRAITLFGILTLYALTMEPFGFLISTIIAITLISLHMGARSALQIAIMAVAGPVALYLVATRMLAVSLPELNAIELFYARLFS